MQLTILDWVICLGYLVLVLVLGLRFARQQHTNEDYFVGNRRMHWFPIGLSIFAGTFSSLSFVGLPGAAAFKDYHLYLAILCIPLVVMPIVGWLFLPLFHNMKVTSPYEYLERRFDRPVRLLASALFMLYTIGWMGALLVAVGRILGVVLNLTDNELMLVLIAVGLIATFYTAMGGVKAVVWTDAIQAFALGGGMLVILILALDRAGGWSRVHQIAVDHDKFAMFKMEIHSKENNFFAALVFGVFVYLAGHAFNFTAVQRYVSMPTLKDARRSLWVNGIMVGVTCLIFFLVGTALFAFYTQNNSEVMTQLESAGKTDELLPRFVMTELPSIGLAGLLVAGLFAAAMSSIDSGINSMTASVVCDWLGDRKLSLKLSRILTVAFGLAGITIALILQRATKAPIFDSIMMIAGMFLGLMFGVFLLGILSSEANSFGVWTGLIAGILVYALAKSAGMTKWWDGLCTSMTTLVVGLFASQRKIAIPSSQ